MAKRSANLTPPPATQPPPSQGVKVPQKIAPALKPLLVPIASINLDADNVRLHGTKNMEAIKASLAKWGQVKNIVVQKKGRVVRAGNGTVLAAVALGWTHVAAAVVEMTDQEATAYAIADNRTGDLSEFDWDKLKVQAKELASGDFDLSKFGWDPKEMEKLLRTPGDVTEPPAPALPEKAVTEPGDCWLLGKHRLLCGSATDPESVDKLMRGRKVQMVWTDPPYGVEVVGGSRMLSQKERLAAGGKTIQGDGMDLDKLEALLRDSFTILLKHCLAGAPWYVASPGGINTTTFGLVMAELKISRHLLIWVKDRFVISRGDFHYRHEILYYGWKPGGPHVAPDTRTLDTVWEFPRPSRSEFHPTMKPVALVAKAIETSSAPGDLVADVYGGSGTTLLACEQLGRDCCMMDMDPRYCDVIVRRWQQLTGHDAVLEGGKGATWLQEAKARGVEVPKEEPVDPGVTSVAGTAGEGAPDGTVRDDGRGGGDRPAPGRAHGGRARGKTKGKGPA